MSPFLVFTKLLQDQFSFNYTCGGTVLGESNARTRIISSKPRKFKDSVAR